MNKLETKVAARNEVNAIARAYTAKCRLALAPLVGQKILLANSLNSSKLRKLINSLNLPDLCYVSAGRGYSVVACFRVAKTTDAGTFYAEATLYLYDIKDGVMVANDAYLNHIDSEHYRTDFSASEIFHARTAVSSARAILQNAERALCSFGEHDNN